VTSSFTASIVIPVYNQAQYLGEAITSALDQTQPAVEVIVVDDGSTDDSADVARVFPVRLLQISNRGLPGARNAGALASVGDGIVPLDADDCLDRHFLEKTLGFLRDPRVGAVQVGMELFGGKSARILPRTASLEELLDANTIAVCGLIRKAALVACGGYNTRLVHGYEDWDLWIDLLKRGWKIEAVNEILFRYRVKEVSMLTQARLHWHDWNLQRMTENHRSLYAQPPSEALARPTLPTPALRDYGAEEWAEQRERVRLETAALLGSEESAVVIDGGKLDLGAEDPRFLAFPERLGRYWGPPLDDAAAVREFGRVRPQVAIAAIPWSGRWWLEAYPGLHHELRRFPCLVDNERVLVFDLRADGASAAG
jgi:GT2 family glycosyltransferase